MSVHEQKLRALWQSLPSETVTFTSDQMQSRVRKFQAKHKRRDRVEYVGILALFGLMAYTLNLRSDWKAWVACGLAVLGALIMMWNYHKFAKVKPSPSLNSSSTLLEFMRRELKRQRDAAASAWRWYLLPAIPFLTFVLAFRWMEEGSTLIEITDMRFSLLLLTAFLIAFLAAHIFWYFLRAARYQHQLDELERYVTE